MPYDGINHVTLVVSDTEQSTRFFRDGLGLRQNQRVPSWFGVGDCGLHLVTLPHARFDRAEFQRVQHAALQVEDRRAVLSRLLDLSLDPFQFDFEFNPYPIPSPDAKLDRGAGSVFVRDPDGNVLEIMESRQPFFEREPNPFAPG